jgi:Leucine-rich repeat (LRR) protein
MSNQIEFDQLHNVMPEILGEVSKSNSSELLNCRLVSTSCYAQCETVLRALWISLHNNSPKGVVDVVLNMGRIEKESPAENYSALIKFKKLAHVFKKVGVDLPAVPLPTRTDDFQLLQNEIDDNAMKAVWGRLHNLFPAVPNVPPVNANVSEIRAFLNDPNNNAALAAPIENLDLTGLNLIVVPPELERLSGLRLLDLSNNKLVQVPNFNLPHLTQLFLANNQLAQVPNFDNLPNLTQLTLKNNQLVEVPNFSLLNLTCLSLANNRLAQVPNFNNLPNLTWLSLKNNQLAKLPNFNLPNLTQLAVENNQLIQVPNFNLLPALTALGLQNNYLVEVPNFNLPNLTHLALHNNQLAQLPDFNLPHLTQLSLSNNQLRQVPNFNLPHLTHLSLNENPLLELPSIILLPNLTHLRLENN